MANRCIGYLLVMLFASLGFTEEVLQETTEEEESREESGDQTDDRDVETIIVVGTRLGLMPSQLSSTVLTMNREMLLDSGASTLQEVLADLPQNVGGGTVIGGGTRAWFGDNENFNGTDNVFGASTINLRGVGDRHTLVLVDGVRLGSSGLIGGYTDVSSIPLEMVERVEIQLDGASAVYGADAIGGVVNIILRKDYSGTVATLRYTDTTGKGAARLNGSLAKTFPWDSGSFTGTVTWFRQADQSASNTRGLEGFLSGLSGDQTYTDRGIVVGIDSLYSRSSWVELEGLSAIAGRSVTYVDIPEGQDGTNLMLSDFNVSDEISRMDNTLDGVTFIPGQERFTLAGRVRQQLTDTLEFTAALNYSPTETVTNRRHGNGNLRYLDVPADHPQNPFGQMVRIRRTSEGIPPLSIVGDTDRWRFSSSLDGSFERGFLADWEWSVKANFVYEDSVSEVINELPQRYDSRCRCYLSSVHDAAVDGTLNIFGESLQGSNSEEFLQSLVLPVQSFETLNTSSNLEFFLRKELELLPAGNARLVFGASQRKEGLEYKRDAFSGTRVYLLRPESGLSELPADTSEAGEGNRGLNEALVNELENIHGLVYTEPTADGKLSKDRTFDSVFSEFHVPLLADMPLVESFSVNAAWRYEDTDDYGSSRTWSLGGVWRLTDKLTARTRRGTSFSVPRLSKSSLPTNIRPITPFLIDFNGVFSSSFLVFGKSAISGGNSGLRPEAARTTSYGIDYVDFLTEGLDVRVNYSEGIYRDRINSTLGFLTRFLFLFPDWIERYPGVYRFDSAPCDDPEYTGHLTSIEDRCHGVFLGTDERTLNIGDQESTYIDLFVDYDVDTPLGRFALGLNVATPHKWIIKEGPQEPPVDLLDRGRASKFRQKGSVSWNKGNMRVVLNLTHASRTFSTFNNLGGDYDGIESIEKTIYKYPVVANLLARYRMERSFGMGLSSLDVVFGLDNVGGKYATNEKWITTGCIVVNADGGCDEWTWEPMDTDLEGFLPSNWRPNRGRRFYLELNAVL